MTERELFLYSVEQLHLIKRNKNKKYIKEYNGVRCSNELVFI